MKTKLLIKVTLLLLLAIPTLSFSQAPNLGAVGSFAVFTAAGAFSNVGSATSVNGDVGTNAGAFSAFTPGTLVGTKNVVNTMSASAATDVATAYSFLSNKTCGTTLTSPLGNGQTLTPGVYCISTASTLVQGVDSTLNMSLTLDAQGYPDALFFIKINGAFATSAHSQVILINGASFNNVYWQVGGQIVLGAGSTFGGTIIANGAINLMEGASLYGRALSVAGAISLHNNIVQLELANNVATNTTNAATVGSSIASIYPNPSTGNIIIQMNQTNKTINSQLKLYNLMGVEIMSRSIANPTTSIPTDQYLPGIYYYKLMSENKNSQSGKLIFQ